MPLTALLLAALVAPAAFGQSSHHREFLPHDRIIAAEAGGAVIVGYGLSAGAGVGTFFLARPHMRDPEWGICDAAALGVLVGVAVTPACCALGVHGAGMLMHERRQYWPALLGACGGMVVGTGLVWATWAFGFTDFWVASLAVGLAPPPAGAVIGYNMGRPVDASYGGFEQRLEMPRMAMTMTHDDQNRPIPGVRCDLVTLRS